MFGIGATELVLILAVALIVVGPKRLPGPPQPPGRSPAEYMESIGAFGAEMIG